MNSSSGATDGRFFGAAGDTVARDRYSTLLDTVADGIYQLSPDMHVVAVNDAFATTTGYPRGELLGEHVSLFLDADAIERLEGEITRQRDSLDPTPVEVAVHTAHGGTVECGVQVSLLITDGEFRGSLGVVRTGRGTPTVTSQPTDHEELNILDRVSDGFVGLDDEWRFTYLNDPAAELLEVVPEKANGEVIWDLFPEAVDTPFERNYRRAMDEQVPVSFEEFFPPLESWFEVSTYPSETGLSVYFRDVTQRRERQQADHERGQQLTAYKQFITEILNAIDDLFYVVDRTGRFQRWNESVRTVTGYSDDEIEAMGPLEFIVEEDQEQVADGIEDIFETGSARVEATIRTKQGERVPIEFAASAVDTPSGEPMIAGIGRDITERNHRQQQLEASNERLEEFAYAASHDLQEPLRMVSSYLQLIEKRYEDALDEEGQEFLEFAVDGADRMREMIDGLLAYSRIESEGDSFERVELDDVVATVQEDLRLLCDDHSAEITVAPLPCVEGDDGQLRQLFQNLIENALENSGDAAPRIHIAAERDGDRWLLSVRDEGIGIDPSDADRIFEVFQSLDAPDEQDSGIGLALCQRIVEHHGGDIWVDSSPGEGATFSFTLPAGGGDDE